MQTYRWTVVSARIEYALVESWEGQIPVYGQPSTLGATIGLTMIIRVLLLVIGLAGVYASLTVLRVHLYVTLLLLFLCAGPLSYLVFHEGHE